MMLVKSYSLFILEQMRYFSFMNDVGKKSSDRSLKNRLLIIFLILPFLQPNFLNFISPVHNFFIIWQVFNLMMLMIFYLSRNKISLYFLLLFIWRLYIFLVSTIQQHSIDFSSLSRTVMIFGISLIIELGFRRSPLDTLWGIYIVAIIISLWNLVSCLKGGMLIHLGTPYYVYGLRTRFTDSTIPLIIISMLISWLKSRRLFSSLSIFTIMVVGFQLVYEWVATGIFVLVLIVLLVLLETLGKFRLLPKTTFLSGIIVLISIVFFRIQNTFSFIIVDLLHKSLDFHGRITIWDSAIQIIKLNPIFGFGEKNNGGFVNIWWSQELAPAHDTLLQLLHDGGIISAFLLFIIYLYAVNQIANKDVERSIANLLSVAVLATCFAILTELTYYYAYFYILPAICANVYKLISTNRVETDRKSIKSKRSTL